MKLFSKISYTSILPVLLFFLLAPAPFIIWRTYNSGSSFYPLVFAENASNTQTTQTVTQNARVDTTSAGLVVKVAPGELLPISVKLLNFGGGKKVDVTVTYGIFSDKEEQIYTTTETIAVETTASFIKTIQIPFGTTPGEYTARASIVYKDQLVPATTQFPFIVENKIIGLFQSDFYLYGIIMLIFSMIVGVIGRFWVKKRRSSRLNPHEYAKIPSKDRIFYEIISDTIMQMRNRMGDKALDIAKSIDGLIIDGNSGRVLQIKADPAKIVALLIFKYEKLLGQRMSFAIKKPNDQMKDHLTEVDKNLIVIKK